MKNIFATMIFASAIATWAVLFAVVYTNYTLLYAIVLHQPQEVVQDLKIQKRINNAIQNNIDILMENVNADRILVYKLYNMNNDDGKYTHGSAINESVRFGVTSEMYLRQKLLLTPFSKWTEKTSKGKCVLITNAKPTDQLYDYLRETSVLSAIKCGILNNKGVWFASISVEYTKENLSLDTLKYYQSIVERTAAEIGAIMSIR
jgi:hypothetical protein